MLLLLLLHVVSLLPALMILVLGLIAAMALVPSLDQASKRG